MNPDQRLLFLALAAGVLFALMAALLYRLRTTPAERERRRRTRLYELGRLGDGLVVDVEADTLYYTYSVHGVAYNTSQDITALRDLVPRDPSLVIGPVSLKYLVRNPANSIVVCERWSGLRVRSKDSVGQAAASPGN